MNLFWLRYVSYGFLAGAVLLYSAIRLNQLYLSRATKVLLYVGCVVMACLTWYVAENNAQQHSPRRLLMGTVANLRTTHRRSGGEVDQFQLRLDGGRMSPEFSAHLPLSASSPQPLQEGDYLGVLYRTWDNVAVTIDELEGQNTGWHFSHAEDPSPSYIVAVALGGVAGLISALVSSRNQPARKREPDTVIKLSE